MSNSDHATKEDLSLLNDSVQRIQEKIDQSKILNGGFDTIMFKIDHIQENQQQTNDKVDKISEALYEPDQGFFSRVKSMEMANKNIEAKMDEHQEKDIALFEDLTKTVKISNEAVQVTKDLQSIAGQRLEEIDSVVKMRKTFDKLFWLILTGTLATIGKFLWDIFSASGRH